MKISYGENLIKNKEQVINDIALQCGILKETATLLVMRNIDTVEKAKEFLNPNKTQFNDPFDFVEMRKIVDRIRLAKENGQNVLIFGDYDVDGICSVTILRKCLIESGVNPIYTIPEREDGYGLNYDKILKINNENKIDLIITVDCGISSFDIIEKLKELNIETIVTDHHTPPEILPNCLKINPHIVNSGYKFADLCGAGVAYKLGYALIGERANQYLDYVALATVADSMELVGENRAIVCEGVKLFNNGKIRDCFKELLGDSQKSISAQSFAFTLAPRLNAGGRMGDANTSLSLLNEEDPIKRFNLAVKLNQYNVKRQVECDNIFHEAQDIISEKEYYNDNVILVYSDNWKIGVTGIIASKLCELYNRPVIVFANLNGELKGSARSIENISIYELLTECKDILVAFGGHSQAAGVTVTKENFDNFRNLINKKYQEKYSHIKTEREVYADMLIDKSFNNEFAKEINLLEPFGVGNKKPIFALKTDKIIAKRLNAESVHYSFSTNYLDMLYFNAPQNQIELLNLPIKKIVLFESEYSVFKGKDSVKGFVKKIYNNFDKLEITDSLKLSLFEKKLDVLQENFDNNINIQKINYNNEDKTLYIINDIDNLNKFSFLNDLPIYFYEITEKESSSCILVCPKTLPNYFTKIIYLDKPFYSYQTNIKSYILSNEIGYKEFDKISLDKTEIASYYEMINKLLGNKFENASSFYEIYQPCENGYMFIFVLKVMLELGIYKVEVNSLVKTKERNPIMNSKIYSNMSLLKGKQ